MHPQKGFWRYIVAVVLGAVIAFGAGEAFAADCDRYAASAVAQTKEYQQLGCTGGDPLWWNLEPRYHANWCNSLPADSPAPDAGEKSREDVLELCRAGGGGNSNAAATITLRNGTEFVLEAYADGAGWASPAYPIPAYGTIAIEVKPGTVRITAFMTDAIYYPEVTYEAALSPGGQYELILERDAFQIARRIDCPRAVAGRWDWPVNGVATFFADGTVVQGAIRGAWRCIDDSVHINWNHGYEDMLRLSRDGQQLAGSGSAKDGSTPQGFAISANKLD